MRKNAHEKSRHYSVCILACHLGKPPVADDILHRIPVAIAQQVRMVNLHDEEHTSLVYSRFKDSIHTRTVSWLILTLELECLDLFVLFTPDNGCAYSHSVIMVSFLHAAQCLRVCD